MTRYLLAALLVLPVAAAEETFVNPIAEGADPWVVRHGDQYIWCASEGNRGVSLWVTDRLTSLGTRHVVWEAPEDGPYAKEVWAPELHLLDGRWHIYVAASDGNNANHLSYVLRSRDDDPLGPYTIHGPLATGGGEDGQSPNLWAIDMTVLEHGEDRYALWSGWDAAGTDRQFLYIAPMKSPTELAGPRVLMCENDTHLWERTEEHAGSRGLAEGPQVLKHGGRTFVTYSSGASWLPTYKLGLLELVGPDPLDPDNWKKFPEPVFRSSDETFGVGHSCFVKSPDGSEWWHVYHAKRDPNPGWRRAMFVQPFGFDDSGLPDFGSPVAPGTPVPRPSGETLPDITLPFSRSFTESSYRGFSYYGHQQFLASRDDGLHLGIVPQGPVNGYRSGEKVILDGSDFTDFEASTILHFVDGGRDAGILFRATHPSVGFDAQRGYFAGLIADSRTVILGKSDGSNWAEIARAPVDFDPAEALELAVTASGPQITISLDGEPILTSEDVTHTSGAVGLRVVDTHARFTRLEIKPLP